MFRKKVNYNMNTKDWKYYNHAIIPSTEPHEEPVFSDSKKESIWKIGEGGIPLLARWTTDFDCGYETGWWYVIKDTPFDISVLKSKRRYEINKGNKNFEVRRIDPLKYINQLFNVERMAFEGWPEKYRPVVKKAEFEKDITKWNKAIVYGGFDRKSNELCGYAYLQEYPKHLEFNVLRVKPESERNGINAAMVSGILEDNKDRIGSNFYINDGARSIRHETAFQSYLEKYFGFRKAYCKLHIKYRFPVNIAVRMLYPFRNKISNESRMGSLICAVLKMEECRRACK